jgi:hypothetical protein
MSDSDFAAARVHLDQARQCLQGDDETSRRAVEALELLIEATTTAENSHKSGAPHRQIFTFKTRGSS